MSRELEKISGSLVTIFELKYCRLFNTDLGIFARGRKQIAFTRG
jgi:hypothetical protein